MGTMCKRSNNTQNAPQVRGTASIVFLVMMHARLRGWCSVCDNTAAVMLGVGKGTYVRCSQSPAGVISPGSSHLIRLGQRLHSSLQSLRVAQCAKCFVGDD